MEVMIQRKNVAIDATMLTTLMACPRYFDYRMNHALVPLHGKSKSLEMGSAVHAFLEYYHKSLIKGFTQEIAQANGWAMLRTYVDGCPGCADFIPDEKNAQPRCGHKPDEFRGAAILNEKNDKGEAPIDTVISTINEYLEYYRNDSWVHLEAEVVKQKLIYSDDEVRILWKAKLDHIVDTPNGIKSVDHKTFAQRRDTTNLNNQFMGQCVVLGNTDMIINKIGFQKSLKPIEKFSRPLMSYSTDRLNEWVSETVPYWVKMYLSWAESDYWPPNHKSCDSQYGLCEFHTVCEADRDKRVSELQRLFKVGRGWDISND